MRQRKEFLAFARMIVTPLKHLGIRKDYMSQETKERYEAFRQAFLGMVDSANDDLVTEETMLAAARALKEQDETETQEMEAQDGNEG